MSDYSELKRLAEAATPTPWERGDGNEVMVSEEGDEAYWSWEQAGPAQIHGSGEQPVRDADFIAAANPAAVLALIAENDRLKTLRSTTERDLAQELEVWRHGPSCWTCGDTGDVHDMVGEWRGQCDCNAAKVIDVASERDQIKAENEALRRGIDPKWASMDQTFVIEFLRHRSVFDAENIDRMIQFAVESAQYVQLNPSKEVQP